MFSRKPIILTLIVFIFSTEFIYAQVTHADSLEIKLKSLTKDTLRASTLLELADEYSNADPKKAETYLIEALELSQGLSFKSGIAKSYFIFGNLSENASRYGDAIIQLNKALKVYNEIGEKKKISNCLNKIGDVYWWLADYQHALENYFKALAINEQSGNKNGIATCYRNIGWVYNRQQNYDQALNFFQKSLDLFREIKDTTHTAILYADLGTLYGYKKNHAMSLQFFLSAFDILKNTGRKESIATIYANLAIAYSNNHELILAKEYARKALDVFIETNQRVRIAETYTTMGEIFLDEGNYDSVIYYEEKALRFSREVNYLAQEKTAYNVLAKAYAGMKKYKEAFEYYQKFSNLNDSLASSESIRQVSEMQSLYESGKKEQQIELQNLKIEKQDSDIKRKNLFLFSALAGMLIFLFMAFMIWKAYKAKKKTSEELAVQKAIVDQKNKDITDSINYAQHIQEAVFPEKEIKYRLFPDAFVYFKPRDIVSGDFYWFAEKDGNRFIAAVDCTGHGVPGAFMSIIGNHLLNEIVLDKGILQPSEILNHLHKGVRAVLKQEEQKKQSPDGMDIALLCFEKSSNELQKVQFAGAHRPLYLVSDGILKETKSDKFPIGGADANEDKKFTNHFLSLKKGDVIYISSDGYADQFGGTSGKKLMSKNFKELLLANSNLNMPDQENILDTTFEKWKGIREQVDDVLVIGIRI